MIIRPRWRATIVQLCLWLFAAGGVAYFGQQAYVGDHGLVASRSYEVEIEQLSSKLADLKATHDSFEHRIDLMRSEKLDPDLLDEQARIDLGWLHPDDRVIQRR
jgi:cell division protein FtsB